MPKLGKKEDGRLMVHESERQRRESNKSKKKDKAAIERDGAESSNYHE